MQNQKSKCPTKFDKMKLLQLLHPKMIICLLMSIIIFIPIQIMRLTSKGFYLGYVEALRNVTRLGYKRGMEKTSDEIL